MMNNQKIDLLQAEHFLSPDAAVMINKRVLNMMVRIDKGDVLRDVLADELCCGDKAETNDAIPETFCQGLNLSRNNAYHLAEYIIERVSDQTEAFASMLGNSDKAVNDMVDAMIDDLNVNDHKDLYEAVKRMHALNEGLRMMAPLAESKAVGLKKCEGRIEVPPYEGEVSLQVLKSMKAKAAKRVQALKMPPQMMKEFAREFTESGTASVQGMKNVHDSLALKAITATVTLILARSGELPEEMNDVPLDAIIASTCMYNDVQMIAATVRPGQQTYENTMLMIDGAVGLGILALLVVAIKSGVLFGLMGLAIANPWLALACGLLAAAVGTRVCSALSKAKDKFAMKRAEKAMDKAMANSEVKLPVASGKEKMMEALNILSGEYEKIERTHENNQLSDSGATTVSTTETVHADETNAFA